MKYWMCKDRQNETYYICHKHKHRTQQIPYLKRAVGQRPIFLQKDFLEVPWGKGYLVQGEALNLFGNQDGVCIQSHSVLPTPKAVTGTEKKKSFKTSK